MLLHVSDMKFAREQTVRLRIEFTVFLAGYSFAPVDFRALARFAFAAFSEIVFLIFI